MDPTILLRLAIDVLAMLVLVGWLYRRRHSAPEMPLVFVALNIGLFTALSAISAGDFQTGIGFGLFGLLSLVRLRSAAFTLKDVAYAFVSLVLGLVNGLPERQALLTAGLSALLLIAVGVVDDSRSEPARVTMRLTLDRVCTSVEDVRAEVEHRLDVVVDSVAIDSVDFVRETTRVSARYTVDDPWWSQQQLLERDDAETLESDPAGEWA